jgi:GTPase
VETERQGARMRAYVLHPEFQSDSGRRDPQAALEEAVALAHALPDLDVVGGEVVKLRQPRRGSCSGKASSPS